MKFTQIGLIDNCKKRLDFSLRIHETFCRVIIFCLSRFSPYGVLIFSSLIPRLIVLKPLMNHFGAPCCGITFLYVVHTVCGTHSTFTELIVESSITKMTNNRHIAFVALQNIVQSPSYTVNDKISDSKKISALDVCGIKIVYIYVNKGYLHFKSFFSIFVKSRNQDQEKMSNKV